MDHPHNCQTAVKQFTLRRAGIQEDTEDSFDLTEPPQNRHEEKIKELRSRIHQNENNNFLDLGRSDDAFLMIFLRARRYNVEESFQLLSNYIEFRSKNAAIFENLSAWQLHHVIEDGFPCVLPYSDQNGAQMIIIFAGSWDTDTYGTEEILKAFILSMERLIENDEAQLNGIVIIADFSGWTASHASRLSLSFVRQVFSMFQDHYPARFVGFHFVNEPWYVKAALTLLKPFIHEKIWKRIHVHGNNMATLHDHCHQDFLPAEFGGNKSAVNREYWARVLLDSDRTNGGHVYGENH
ncbi:Clavesin-1 [Desmophyllum pertusum]|uniref:Clavesin-1 n=1 Tax=Desmophyllum pertusum TaxID=174260 RepID=A0A9W9YPN5_9CNID|nr:Clavesin-1 [Desmophyllum pertusum]